MKYIQEDVEYYSKRNNENIETTRIRINKLREGQNKNPSSERKSISKIAIITLFRGINYINLIRTLISTLTELYTHTLVRYYDAAYILPNLVANYNTKKSSRH